MEYTLKAIYILSKPYLIYIALIFCGLFFSVLLDKIIQKKHQETPLKISNSTLEAIKWFALVLMTLDHINRFILHESIQAITSSSRVVMPLFGFVLAFNLARPNTLENGTYDRVIKRLTIFALIASIPFIALGNRIHGLSGGWWPLNVLFMLLVSTTVIKLLDENSFISKLAAILLGLAAGSSIEFWWPGIIYCICAWYYCKKPNFTMAYLGTLMLIALYPINLNFWALGALPIIFIAPYIDIKIPRYRNLFYYYYPAHLTAIWLYLLIF